MGHSVAEYMVCLVSNVQTLAEEKGKGCNAVKSAPSSHLWTTVCGRCRRKTAAAAAVPLMARPTKTIHCRVVGSSFKPSGPIVESKPQMKHFSALALDLPENRVGQAHLAHTLAMVLII